jgi:CRISPR-associated endoribonuclease Cas6
MEKSLQHKPTEEGKTVEMTDKKTTLSKLKYHQLTIEVELKVPIHFQKAPEAISKMVYSALIKGGYREHYEHKPKNYVFSNLGKANEKGYFEDYGKIILRSLHPKVVEQVGRSLFLYEDNIFRVLSLKSDTIGYRPIKSMLTLNPVFLAMKDGNFWTFNRNGDLNQLFDALTKNLVRKYETAFGERLDPDTHFINYFQIRNNKPMTYYFKGVKFFGNKFYIEPKMDEISQRLAFTAIGAGLGHKNSSVGGGFLKWSSGPLQKINIETSIDEEES